MKRKIRHSEVVRYLKSQIVIHGTQICAIVPKRVADNEKRCECCDQWLWSSARRIGTLRKLFDSVQPLVKFVNRKTCYFLILLLMVWRQKKDIYKFHIDPLVFKHAEDMVLSGNIFANKKRSKNRVGKKPENLKKQKYRKFTHQKEDCVLVVQLTQEL